MTKKLTPWNNTTLKNIVIELYNPQKICIILWKILFNLKNHDYIKATFIVKNSIVKLYIS